MSSEQWKAVDDYLNRHYWPSDPIQAATLQAQAAAGLPTANVAPNQGKFLMMLAKMSGAKRILEIGTLGGFSTIWLARALPPDGHLITLEYDPTHAEVATQNIAAAGFANQVSVRVGPAIATLPILHDEGQAAFDFVFIDADKGNNANYVQWAITLGRPGTVIVVDNVVRDGRVLLADSDDPSVKGTRLVHEYIASEPRLTAVALQTVGSKGYDGFTLAMITG